jgi:hypothetical protein
MIISEQRYESFLLADCGSSTTTVALFDITENGYRLVARATAPATSGPPWLNIVTGVQQAIARISEITHRPLLTESGHLIIPTRENGTGVDHFGVTVSAAAPLRLITAGLLEDVSLASARRAAHSIYTQELDTFSLNDSRNEQEQISALLEQEPEVILLTGGVDGGDTRRLMPIVELIELGIGLQSSSARPSVIYAGNSNLREEITSKLGSTTTVHVVDNVRPDLQTEKLGETVDLLGKMYGELRIDAIPGIQELKGWSDYTTMSTARAFGKMIEYFGALYKSRVLGLDLGSNSVTLALAGAQQSSLFVDSSLGMGRQLPNLLQETTLEEILRNSPVPFAETALRNLLHDKALHPHTIPMTEEELHVEQLLARQVMAKAAGDAAEQWGWTSRTLPPFHLLIARGSTLSYPPRLGQTVLMLLDALQPTGIFSLAVDKHGVLPMLGLLAAHEPEAVVQILEGGVLVDLGWVIAPAGRGRTGNKAMHIMVEAPDQGEYRIDAQFGELITVPLDAGVPAQLTLKPERGVDIGFGPGRGKKITVHGGAVGLVVDCRGRPLQLPEDNSERRSQLNQWLWDMGG